ncbi:MAG: trigger factor, partial [Bacteroidota bacterium]
DGFRPGRVPFGLISKMYRKLVMEKEVNKLVSESIHSYITEQEIQILGEPIPGSKEEQKIDWETESGFEFTFDIGMVPDFELDLNTKIKIPKYKIAIDKKLLDQYTENITRRYGNFVEAEDAPKAEMFKGKLIELDEAGQPLPDGIVNEESSLSKEVIKDDEIKKSFDKLKKGERLDFDIKKAFPNDTEIAGLLNIDKKEIPEIQSNFRFEVAEMQVFKPAELNQDFYDMVFGKDEVKGEDEFKQKITAEIEHNLQHDSEYRFAIDARKVLLDKTKLNLPSEFLRRWLLHSNEGKVTEEQIEKEFDKFEEDLKWQLIKNKISKDNEIKVSEEELTETAKSYARMQFQQYGMANVPDEHLNNYAMEILKREDERRRLHERKQEEKVIGLIKEKTKIDKKEISSEKFNKLFEE